jgi:DNA polymerase I-like protein with 3'-5' exonuclease and polymerase domains
MIDHPSPEVVTDTETTCLYPRDGYVIGIVLCIEEGKGYYIDADYIDESVEKKLQELYDKKVVIMHGAKFDMGMQAYHFGLKFPNWRCTMLEHYMLNENEPHDLKYLAVKYTNMGNYDAKLEEWKDAYCRKNKILKGNFTYDLIPFEIMEIYAGADGDATLRISRKFGKVVENSPKFSKLRDQIMYPGCEFLLKIQDVGVPFSREKLRDAGKILSADILTLQEEFYQYDEVREVEKRIDDKFNPNSPAHLRTLFFDILALPIIKKTPKGEASTDKEVLEKLDEMHAIPAMVSRIRSAVKMKSTYVDKVLRGLDSDSRIRTNFNQHVATSGRLSSSGKLNMQQLPRDDKTIKGCIVPIIRGELTDEWVIYSQDLATAEMYYAAVLSGDQALMDIFRTGGDFHGGIAKAVFSLPCEINEVKNIFPKLRQAAKAISFGILYGSGPPKVAKTAGIPVSEAKEHIKTYFETFHVLKKWIKSEGNMIRQNGCTYSHFGRKRRVPSVFGISPEERGHAVRSAFNFKVQSVASDVNLLAAIETQQWITKNNFPAQIFALVHDSIVGMVMKDSVDEFEIQMAFFTQRDRGCSIPGQPVGCDFGYGESYAVAA